VTLSGANVSISGDVISPGGGSEFHGLKHLDRYDQYTGQHRQPGPARRRTLQGNFNLAPGVTLSTAGLSSDDRRGSSMLGRIATGAGSIAIEGYNTTIGSNSIIDVSGGVHFDSVGKIDYGNGGSIAIAGGRDKNFHAVVGGSLVLGGTRLGYSGEREEALS